MSYTSLSIQEEEKEKIKAQHDKEAPNKRIGEYVLDKVMETSPEGQSTEPDESIEEKLEQIEQIAENNNDLLTSKSSEHIDDNSQPIELSEENIQLIANQVAENVDIHPSDPSEDGNVDAERLEEMIKETVTAIQRVETTLDRITS